MKDKKWHQFDLEVTSGHYVTTFAKFRHFEIFALPALPLLLELP
jgi:hypothetical protein